MSNPLADPERLRRYEGADQLDLFKTEKAEPTDKWAFRVACSVVGVVIAMLIATAVWADENHHPPEHQQLH